MREIHVHAESGDEARADGAAALGVDPDAVGVEILDGDEHGVTARVYVLEAPPASDATAAPDETAAEDRAAAETAAEDRADDAEPLAGSEHAQAAHRHLEVMLDCMGVEATVELVQETDDEVALGITGEDLTPVIGSFGQTLNALQFLTNLMVNRGGRRRRVVVDAAGYRERRRERLEAIAREHAERAKDERRGVILEGLRAAERRIIHTTLQNDPDVVTFSEGEEPHRRLIISPKTGNN